MTIGGALLALSLALSQAATAEAGAKAIEVAKSSIVRDMDPKLPRVPLARWLAKLVPGVKTAWEVNDCGEQTGNPDVDRNRDFPMCVQADLTLAKNRHLYLLFAVGTFNKGLTPGPPHFFYGAMVEDGRPTSWVKKLGDLPAALDPVKPPRWDAPPNQELQRAALGAIMSSRG